MQLTVRSRTSSQQMLTTLYMQSRQQLRRQALLLIWIHPAICDAMKTAMTEISIDGLTGAGMTWDAAGETNKAPKAVKIVNGVYEMQ